MSVAPTPAIHSAPATVDGAFLSRYAGQALVLVVITFLAFCRLIVAEFSWWDDWDTIHHNPQFNPPTLETVHYYWTHFQAGLYVPVTQTVWAMLARLAYVGFPDDYGITLNPNVFHTANLAVHLGSCLVALQLLRRLVGPGLPAMAGAVLFAIHPVQVESVAWISGMKDLLCWFFCLVSLLLYVRRVQSCEGKSAWLSFEIPCAFLFLIIAILSKPTAIVLPATMLVVGGLVLHHGWRKSILELLPFFVVSAGGAFIARSAQHVTFLKETPLWQRPLVAGDAIAFYFRTIVWPANLTIDYGRMPSRVLATWSGYLWWIFPAIVIGVALTLAVRRAWTIPLAAIAMFVIGFAPVSGIAAFQMQAYSTVTDHYLYFSMLGPALLLASALAWRPTRSITGVALAALLALSVQTFAQCGVWHDSYTLFGHGLAVNPRSFASSGNLASVYSSRKPPDLAKAEANADHSYSEAPDNFVVVSNYAIVKAIVGKREEAFTAWERCRQQLRTYATPAERAAFAGEVAGTLLEMGELDRAKTWTDEAINAGGQDAKTLNAISAVQRALAARAAARATTRPATTPAPTHPPASAPAPAVGPD